MDKIQYPDWFVFCRDGFDMNTGNKNPIGVNEDSSFSQQSTSSPFVFDSVKIKYYFSTLNDANSFSTVDYGANVKKSRLLPQSCI